MKCISDRHIHVHVLAISLMLTVGGKDHESAESYFKNIEEQTGTLILWPSKLKIGAKSKKGMQMRWGVCMQTS